MARVCLLFTMFTGVQHVSALIEMHFYLLLNSVPLELRSASESIHPVLINLGRPKFEFDSARVKYGVRTGLKTFSTKQRAQKNWQNLARHILKEHSPPFDLKIQDLARHI